MDDFIIVGAKGALGRIEMECSGFGLKRSSAEEDEGLYVGQQAYIKELLSRHSEVAHATTPFPGVPDEVPEPEPTIEQVRTWLGWAAK